MSHLLSKAIAAGLEGCLGSPLPLLAAHLPAGGSGPGARGDRGDAGVLVRSFSRSREHTWEQRAGEAMLPLGWLQQPPKRLLVRLAGCSGATGTPEPSLGLQAAACA